jgi:hypothetical protein
MHFPHLSILIPSILASLALTFAVRPGGKGTPPFLEALLHFLLVTDSLTSLICYVNQSSQQFLRKSYAFWENLYKSALYLGFSVCKGLGKNSPKVREKVFFFY